MGGWAQAMCAARGVQCGSVARGGRGVWGQAPAHEHSVWGACRHRLTRGRANRVCLDGQCVCANEACRGQFEGAAMHLCRALLCAVRAQRAPACKHDHTRTWTTLKSGSAVSRATCASTIMFTRAKSKPSRRSRNLGLCSPFGCIREGCCAHIGKGYFMHQRPAPWWQRGSLIARAWLGAFVCCSPWHAPQHPPAAKPAPWLMCSTSATHHHPWLMRREQYQRTDPNPHPPAASARPSSPWARQTARTPPS